jgi:small subunit ribosomal protein S1
MASDQALSDFNVGDQITAYVANIDKKARSVSLSIRGHEAAAQRDQLKELNTQTVDSAGPATIGDLIKEQLEK